MRLASRVEKSGTSFYRGKFSPFRNDRLLGSHPEGYGFLCCGLGVYVCLVSAMQHMYEVFLNALHSAEISTTTWRSWSEDWTRWATEVTRKSEVHILLTAFSTYT